MMMKLSLLLTVAVVLLSVSRAEEATVEYGVDISFPMHYPGVSTNFPWLPHNVDPANNPTPPEFKDMPIQPLGDKQTMYNEYLQGCVDKYEPKKKHERCIESEKDRVEMSLRQPQSMVNYTKNGFTKIRAPDAVFKLIKEFWDLNRNLSKPESWTIGNTYTNHWSAPSRMLSVEDRTLKGGGYILKQKIWNAARDTISEWTGQQLAECSLYGIRIYPEGAMLATHVDRLPLVSSAIINVDQDVDEPWPLEVIGHDGKAHNVTMLPGDLVLYESHSILHGRPFPLKGRFMANVFIHFEPIGPVGKDLVYGTTDLPPYVIRGSPDEENWRRNNPNGHKILSELTHEDGSTEAHNAALQGNMDVLIEVVDANEEVVNARDINGWTPLHEAVRAGNIEIVNFLLDRGADINARTGRIAHQDGSVLWWAKESNASDELLELLKERGAKYFAPGDKEESKDYNVDTAELDDKSEAGDRSEL